MCTWYAISRSQNEARWHVDSTQKREAFGFEINRSKESTHVHTSSATLHTSHPLRPPLCPCSLPPLASHGERVHSSMPLPCGSMPIEQLLSGRVIREFSSLSHNSSSSYLSEKHVCAMEGRNGNNPLGALCVHGHGVAVSAAFSFVCTWPRKVWVDWSLLSGSSFLCGGILKSCHTAHISCCLHFCGWLWMKLNQKL